MSSASASPTMACEVRRIGIFHWQHVWICWTDWWFPTAVLVLNFKYFLLWEEDFATSIYHIFVALCYLTPILGAIVADSWLGKYKYVPHMSWFLICILNSVFRNLYYRSFFKDFIQSDQNAYSYSCNIYPFFASNKAFMSCMYVM